MSKSAMIRARVDEQLKNEVEAIFQEVGLNATQAITMFYRQVKMQHGLPFEVKIPNAQTRQAIEELARGEGVVSSKEEFLEEMNRLRSARAQVG